MTRASAIRAPLILGHHRYQANLEAWALTKLHLPNLFQGTTTTEIRRDRLKVVLLERGLTHSIAGRFDRQDVTWSTVFRRIYDENLV